MKEYKIIPPATGKGYLERIQEILNENARDGWELHTILTWAIVLEKEVKG